MDNAETVKRIARDGIMLALLCVVGMFSIPFGENVKVSLQLLMVFLICLNAKSWYETVIITASYLLLGLFLPIYAGFSSGVTPTFGYVIAFVVASPAIYFLNKLPINRYVRMVLACLVGLLIVYAIGTVYLMLYLNYDFVKTVSFSVLPYLPFDAVKIALAVGITSLLPSSVTGLPPRKRKEDADKENEEKKD